MARNIVTLWLLFATGSCMEMKETVERMVMVRTMGSDLQPAATGYIYKKESDGPASVTKMGASEVIKHFSELYEDPEAYKESTEAPADSYSNYKDGHNVNSYTKEEHVKPVAETTEDDDHNGGLVIDDDDKVFDEYAKKFSHYNLKFADYLHGISHGDTGSYLFANEENYSPHPFGNYGEKGQLGYGVRRDLEKGGAGHYDSEKVRGYSVSKSEKNKNRIYDHDKNYNIAQKYKVDDRRHDSLFARGESKDRFQRNFNKDDVNKDRNIYEETSHNDGIESHTIGQLDNGSDTRNHESRESDESDQHRDHNSNGDEHSNEPSSEEEDARHRTHRTFGIQDGAHAGKSYGYKIKH